MPEPQVQISVRMPTSLFNRMWQHYADDEGRSKESVNSMVVRALESALSGVHGTKPEGSAAAQTRASEESSTSSRAAVAPQSVAQAAKEAAPPGKPASASGGPRRSTDAKAGVKPIERKT
jgi:hypothetical protein